MYNERDSLTSKHNLILTGLNQLKLKSINKFIIWMNLKHDFDTHIKEFTKFEFLQL